MKALVRASNCVCVISVEEQLLDPMLAKHLVAHADNVWSLTSFKDHSEMQIGEYDGTFKLVKQVKLHSMCGYMSDFDLYALKLKQKMGI